MSTTLLAQVIDEAAGSPTREICGLLFGDGDAIEDARACRNAAAEPARQFEIDPVALLAAHRAARFGGPRLVGCYHSHPSGSAMPSACDAEAAPPDGSLWLIVAAGDVRAWRAVADGAVQSRFDPVELVVE